MSETARSDDGPPGRGALGDGLPRIVVPPPGSASREMAARLARVESRNVTHLTPDFPVFWADARGANVRDVDGNVYLDFTAAFGVAAAGHTHPRLGDAIRAQAGRLVHGMGDVHPPAGKVALLERLCALTPWSDARGVLASAGSEAVEIALKTAQLATGRSGAIAFDGGYHGLTLGALSVTAREDFRAPFRGRVPGAVARVPFAVASSDEAANGQPELDALDRALTAAREGGEPVGAVIVEPIQGRGGVRIPSPGFLAGVAERTHAAGALLIFDEIFTGLGRTGTVFALEREGVVPDLLCVGKALGGGLPLSACLGPRPVMDAWPASTGEALHTSTFLGHPLACASALAFLDVLEGEGLVGRARDEGDALVSRLREGLAGCAAVVEVRGRGLLIGVELHGEGTGARVARASLREGLIVLPAGDRGEVVELAPPLTVRRDQWEWAADTLSRVIRR